MCGEKRDLFKEETFIDKIRIQVNTREKFDNTNYLQQLIEELDLHKTNASIWVEFEDFVKFFKIEQQQLVNITVQEFDAL